MGVCGLWPAPFCLGDNNVTCFPGREGGSKRWQLCCFARSQMISHGYNPSAPIPSVNALVSPLR